MIGASTQFKDRTSAPPSDVRVANAVLPMVVATLSSNSTSTEVASAAPLTLDLLQPVSPARLGVAASWSFESNDEQTSEKHAEAGHGDRKIAFGSLDLVTHDAPINFAPSLVADELIKDFGINLAPTACHFGTLSVAHSAGEHTCSARQPSLGVSSLDLPAVSSGIAGLSTRSIKNAIAFLVAAASEITSNSTSLVGA